MYRETVLLPKEHIEKALAAYHTTAYSGIRRVPYGGFFLLELSLVSLYKMAEVRSELVKQGISFNAVSYNDASRVDDAPSYFRSVRFDASGVLRERFYPELGETYTTEVELLANMLWFDGAKGKHAQLRAVCIAQRDEWENQVAFGQLYTMMQLLGAEE